MSWLSTAWHWYSQAVPKHDGDIAHPNAALVNPIAAFTGAVIVAITAILNSAATRRQARAATQQALTATLRHEEQTAADRQRRVTESFSKAVEQIASDKLEVRLGGIYSLERIAKESESDYWTVMEYLSVFLREQTRRVAEERSLASVEDRVAKIIKDSARHFTIPHETNKELLSLKLETIPIVEFPPADIDAVISVIRRRSAEDIERGRERHPGASILVALFWSKLILGILAWRERCFVMHVLKDHISRTLASSVLNFTMCVFMAL